MHAQEVEIPGDPEWQRGSEEHLQEDEEGAAEGHATGGELDTDHCCYWRKMKINQQQEEQMKNIGRLSAISPIHTMTMIL